MRRVNRSTISVIPESFATVSLSLVLQDRVDFLSYRAQVFGSSRVYVEKTEGLGCNGD